MEFTNLPEVLLSRRNLQNKGITFIEGTAKEEFLSYSDLHDAALQALHCLQVLGLRQGDELVFQVRDNKTFLIAFWACICGGIIPIPLSVGQTEDHRQKLFSVWKVLQHPYLLAGRDDIEDIAAFSSKTGDGPTYSSMSGRIVFAESLFTSTAQSVSCMPEKNDIAFIQFSSGSTGNPKGVLLTHGNLLTNMADISEAARYTESDSVISWMPLTHDMGLIGFHLNPLFSGMDQYLMSTPVFIRRPALWMEKTSQHRVTILCSPNFGYRYFLKHAGNNEAANWDLSCVRIVYNGAEPISEKLALEFIDRLSIYGLPRRSMCPVYGLAEASLAVSISGLEDEIMCLHLDRNYLGIGSRIKYRQGDHVAFVNVGRPIRNCSVRITDEKNKTLSEETTGYVQISGRNVTKGYYKNETETSRIIGKDGWLNTGDIGFMCSGCLYITGRAKDIIFVNGQNYYPHDIERTAESIEGIELNKIAVAGFFNEQLEREEIICFIYFREDVESFLPLARSLRTLINNIFGFQIDRVVPVKDIPRTTSGKLQRFKLLSRYRKGQYKEVVDRLARLMEGPGQKDLAGLIAPATLTDRLTAVWQRVLSVHGSGLEDRFSDSGGNSLKAAELSMLVLKEFGVELPIDTVYKKQTIKELAEIIAQSDGNNYQPMAVANKSEFYPVSPFQNRLYYAWASDKFTVAYNTPVSFRLAGKPDSGKIKSSVATVVGRHEVFRYSFQLFDAPVFTIRDRINFDIENITCAAGELDTVLKQLVRPFDLSDPPLVRSALIELKEGGWALFFDFHHIITDGLSVYHFINEMLDEYAGKATVQPVVQYKDYCILQRGQQEAGKLSVQQAFWLDHLKGELPVLELPNDYNRPPVFNTAGEKISFLLDHAISRQLRELAQNCQCSLHVLLFSLYNILLSKYSGQDELVTGIPVSIRNHPDLQSMQGMFVNNLAILSRINGTEPFLAFLERQRQVLLSALNNKEFPFDHLVQLIANKRDASRNPLFDTMFIYQNMGMPATTPADFVPERIPFDPGFSKFDISMEIFDHEETLQCGLEYATSIFRKETILQMIDHFRNLISDVLSHPYKRLADLSVLSAAERQQNIFGFNATEREYPANSTLHQLFQEQVIKSYNDLAVAGNGEKLTYGELEQRAARLAFLLRKKGIVPNIVVGICMQRTCSLIVSMLAVLKAGGCYLPIETDLPPERVRFMLADSQCRLVLTDDNSLPRLSAIDADFASVNVSQLPADLQEGPVEYISTPNNLAYVIYTSGTTGRPKGVMVTHRSLVNYTAWAAKQYIKGEKACLPLFSSVSFDLTVTSIFTPLITGNTIIIYEDSDRQTAIEKIIADNRVNIIKLTPSHLKIIAASHNLPPGTESAVRRFIVGGEQLETRLAREIYNRFGNTIEIFNEYGPTEATVGCMIHAFEPQAHTANVPIGVPAANTRIYILDRYRQPVPAGIRGEIYISGNSVARGYIFNDALTREKFLPDPFIEGQVMYKTGDIARRLPNGIIEYYGRYDQQVKIMGHRIEVGEIEHCLLQFKGTMQAVVTVKQNAGDHPVLCAYYLNEEDSADESAIRDFLSSRLPYYMIPSHIIRVDHIPLTPNGKINYQALPAPERSRKQEDLAFPASETEKLLADAWREILKCDYVSIKDNFFELGGDSIKAVQISSRLFEYGISLPAREILIYYTIENICSRASITRTVSHYEQGVLQGMKDCTPIDSWFFKQDFKNRNYYNQSVLLQLHQEIDIQLLERTFDRLIEHHDGLRMNYDREKGKFFYNNTHLKKSFIIHTTRLSKEGGQENALIELCTGLKEGFDIEKSLLIKAALIKRANDASLLFITAHHLVVDGVSWRILLEDLYNIYHALKDGKIPALRAKAASLIDWQVHLNGKARDSWSANAINWSQIEQKGYAFPCDFETEDWRAENAGKIQKTVNREYTSYLLGEANLCYKTDVPILLNTALAITVRKWTGMNEIVIWQEGFGRNVDELDVSRTVGWFTTMYPVLFEIGETTTANTILAVKEQLRSIAPYGVEFELRKCVDKPDEVVNSKLAGIRLNYLGQFGSELDNDLFSWQHSFTGSETDPVNRMTAVIDINILALGGELLIDIHFNRKAHKESSILWFADHFAKSLLDILDHLKNENDIHLSPSDFDSVTLNQEELDALFK